MKKASLIPLQFFTFLSFFALECLARSLSSSVSLGIGRRLGQLMHLCWPCGRNRVRRNLSKALGDRLNRVEIDRLTRRHFEKRGANLAAGLWTLTAPERQIAERTIFEGVSHFQEALAAGHGVIAATYDGANRELLARSQLPWTESAIGVLPLPTGNPFIDRHLAKRRNEEVGVPLLEPGDGLGAALRWLRRRGVLGVFIDQDAGRGGVFAPFCGHLAPTRPTAAVLALRTGAPIVFADIRPRGEGWTVVFHEPMFPPPSGKGNRESWLIEATAVLNRKATECILRQPENGAWFHRRFEFAGPEVFPIRTTRMVPRSWVAVRGLPESSRNEPESGRPEPTADEVAPFYFLVRSANPLGDACMSIPAVRAIKLSRPDAHVTILCRSNLEPLWRQVAEVDDVIAIPRKSSWRVTGRIIRKRRASYDAALLFPNSASSALEVWSGGIRHVVGYRGHHRRVLLRHCVPEPASSPPTHHLERYLRLVARMGAAVSENRERFLALPSAPSPIEPGQRDWRIALCPGAEFGNAKRWPLERYAAAIEELRRRLPGHRIAVTIVGSPAERELGESLADQLSPPKENLAGKTSIGDLIEHLKTRHLVVSNDTGTMHLAAALGIPVVAIFGSTEPVLTSPVGTIHRVIREKVDCSPCFKRECPIDFRCMTRIRVERVVSEILTLMKTETE